MKSALSGWLKLTLLLFFLAGCSAAPHPVLPDRNQAPFFRPPTSMVPTTTLPASPSAKTTSQATDSGETNAQSTPGAETAAAPCQDNLTFLSDVTIPDGTEVDAEATLDKLWEVENSGNCNWVEGYRVRLIAGPDLGAQAEQALYPARSGSHAILHLKFKAPKDPGTYKSAWQAINGRGEPFGDTFFIVITVK